MQQPDLSLKVSISPIPLNGVQNTSYFTNIINGGDPAVINTALRAILQYNFTNTNSTTTNTTDNNSKANSIHTGLGLGSDVDSNRGPGYITIYGTNRTNANTLVTTSGVIPFAPTKETESGCTDLESQKSNKNSNTLDAEKEREYILPVPVWMCYKSLCMMMRLVSDKANDLQWLEVRKKIVFIFSEWERLGFGDVIADALLFNKIHYSSEEDARRCFVALTSENDWPTSTRLLEGDIAESNTHKGANQAAKNTFRDPNCNLSSIACSERDRKPLFPSPHLGRNELESSSSSESETDLYLSNLVTLRALLLGLIESHGCDYCVPSAQLFRTLSKISPILELMLSRPNLESITNPQEKEVFEAAPKTTLSSAAGVIPRDRENLVKEKARSFRHTFFGGVCSFLLSDFACVSIESWLTLEVLIGGCKNLSSRVLLYYFDEFVKVLVNCISSSHFIAKLHSIHLLSNILGDIAFLKARSRYAESPALLCAVLSSTTDASHHIRFLAFEALKVFIAKPNKPAPVRYILLINNSYLCKYIGEYSTGDAKLDKRLEIEKHKLFDALTSMDPLTHEEELFLNLGS